MKCPLTSRENTMTGTPLEMLESLACDIRAAAFECEVLPSLPDGVKIVDERPYRSSPLVNAADDMVRVTLDFPVSEWRRLKARTLAGRDEG